ncbi:MAG: ATP-binding protein [Oscillospiraceae bacterium]|nr:ATP-binding protein [Oscillospiraceae bacterium]
MKSIFLSREQVFTRPLPLLRSVGTAAPATDLALLTAPDDGFLAEPGGGVNYYLADGCVDRFGRSESCPVCALRPALLLDEGEEKLLRRVRTEGGVTTAEFGVYPQTVLDESLRDMAQRSFAAGTLPQTGKTLNLAGERCPVYELGAKRLVRLALRPGHVNGYAQLSDGSIAVEGEGLFLELRPVRWLYDAQRRLLLSCQALLGGLDREAAAVWLKEDLLRDLQDDAAGDALPENAPYRVEDRDELSLIRAYVEADIPVFLHGLSGDGKSDRVRQIDPLALDIELVNENPETINGRAIYNEAKDEIVDVKPVWLVKLERLCEDGELHILFFDELTNATKQTQSVIFKIVLERFVNNRWPLPPNARIVAAGNDRSESSAAHDLAEPLFGRFAHIYIRTTVENWMPWAVRRRINPYVMEFLANNDLYLRTRYTGTEGHADPRRWEMVSKALDSSGNDFSLLAPIVGPETAEAFIRFFRSKQDMSALGEYSDGEIARFSTARRYQLAQQCLAFAAGRPKEARALVERLGPEFLAWFDYVLSRRTQSLAE